MMLKLQIPIRIHCWGGLGSQCFAWALAIDLKDKFPNRLIQIIQHESGVTRRELELTFLPMYFKVVVLDDFINIENAEGDEQASTSRFELIKTKFKLFIRSFLLTTGLLSLANDDEMYKRIKPWIISIRGHYSYRTISQNTFSQMSLVKHSPFNFDNSNVSSNPPFLGIHWRLGDLLSINSKQPIVEGKLFGTIKALDLADCKDLELKLASDSESIALKKFKAQFPNSKISVVRGGSFSLIENLIPSNIFVGTNSKLSFWIALARHVFYPERYSYLPIEIAHHFAPNSIRGSNIRFY